MTEATTREQKLEQVYALGYEFEAKYGVCPQCTIAALQEVFGVIDDETFKATQGLAGGGALTTQGTCGALIGAMIAMGALVGRDKESFRTTRSRDAMVHCKDVLRRLRRRIRLAHLWQGSGKADGPSLQHVGSRGLRRFRSRRRARAPSAPMLSAWPPRSRHGR